jgi:hypothetical protein
VDSSTTQTNDNLGLTHKERAFMLKHSAITTFESRAATDDKSHGQWSYPSQNRYRLNVLGLLYTFARKAATCHMFCDIDMSAVEEARHNLHDAGHRVTVTAFLLKAIAQAQINCPESRTFVLPGGRLVTFNDITGGFTVERRMPDGPAVFFGEIEAPHQKSLLALSADLKNYADGDIRQIRKLREQKLFAELPWVLRTIILSLASWFPAIRLRCMAATFGLSSLGALGADVAFGPSVCTAVFGVGAVADRAVVREGKIVIRPMLTLVLSYDQRVMDGGVAARFLGEVKGLLEARPPTDAVKESPTACCS